jgi:hypothetical protein
MKKLENIFKEYLEKVGFKDLITLGDDKKIYPITEEDSEFLLKRLLPHQKQNNIFIYIAVIMLCVLFGVGMFFVFYYRNEPVTMGSIFGGNFLALIGIVIKLRQLWIDKFIIDHASIVLSDLQPEEAAKVIVILYTKLKS